MTVFWKFWQATFGAKNLAIIMQWPNVPSRFQIPIGLIKWEWLTFLLVTQDLSLLSASLVSNFWLWPLGTIYKQLVSYCLKVRRVEKNLCGLNSQRRSLRKWLLTSISSLATKRDIDNIAILLQIMCQDIHYYHMSHWSHKGGRTPQSPHTSPQSLSHVENSSSPEGW